MTDILYNIKSFYSDYGSADLSGLGELYTDDIVFTDPLHSLQGIQALSEYFETGRKGLTHCAFAFSDEVVGEEKAVLFWTMQFAHRKLGSTSIEVPGCSHLTLDSSLQKVASHVDYYDAGGLLYEHIPVLGRVVRSVKRRAVGA